MTDILIKLFVFDSNTGNHFTVRKKWLIVIIIIIMSCQARIYLTLSRHFSLSFIAFVVSYMSGSSDLDSFRDGRQVAV